MFITKVLFRFAAPKKSIKQAGLIVDPQQFRSEGFGKIKNWVRNTQTLSDMQRTFKNFNRKKTAPFVHINNSLIDSIKKQNLRDIEELVSQVYFKEIKNCIKNKEPVPLNYNLIEVTKATIVQARSFTDTIMRNKSTDQWYQLTVQFQNQGQKRKVYHVVERFFTLRDWKFIKFNL